METDEKIYREEAIRSPRQTFEDLSQTYSPKTINQVSEFIQSLDKGQFWPEFMRYSAKGYSTLATLKVSDETLCLVTKALGKASDLSMQYLEKYPYCGSAHANMFYSFQKILFTDTTKDRWGYTRTSQDKEKLIRDVCEETAEHIEKGRLDIILEAYTSSINDTQQAMDTTLRHICLPEKQLLVPETRKECTKTLLDFAGSELFYDIAGVYKCTIKNLRGKSRLQRSEDNDTSMKLFNTMLQKYKNSKELPQILKDYSKFFSIFTRDLSSWPYSDKIPPKNSTDLFAKAYLYQSK